MKKIFNFFKIILLVHLIIIALTVTIVVGDDQEFQILNSPFGFHPAKIYKNDYADNGYIDAGKINIKWFRPGAYVFWFKVQPDLNQSKYDFTFYDKIFGAIPAGSGILANIAPQPHGKSDIGLTLKGSYLPTDEEQYINFVKASVERYDGDGIDDMPGIVNPILHWQVYNEPSDRELSDFSALQRITYQAVKEACSECKVLIGGVGGGLPETYLQKFNEEYVPILEELDGQYVDIFDFHWYGRANGDYRLSDPNTGEDVLEYIRSTLFYTGFPSDLPIWITEMGAYSGDPNGDDFIFQSERQQAEDYFKRHIYSLSKKVQKIFPAFGLMEGFKNTGGYFDHTGLIYDGLGSDDLGLGVKKLAYYTYKKMTEELEDADWSTLTMLHDGTDSNYLYLFRVKKNNRNIYIAWWDYFDDPLYASDDTKPITLKRLRGDKVIVKSVIPHAAFGINVNDYSSAFISSNYRVSRGSVKILLNENPVLIMENNVNFSSPDNR